MEDQDQDLEEELELNIKFVYYSSAQNFAFFIMSIIILGLNLFVQK
jgi:hypothetical protein